MAKWKDLGTLLLGYGLITADDLRAGLDLQGQKSIRLGEALVELGRINREDIEWVLSKQLDVPFVIVEDVIINSELLGRFHRDFLLENLILPLYETDDMIAVAMEDPFNSSAIDYLRTYCGKEVSVSIGSGRKIAGILDKAFGRAGLPELAGIIRDVTEKIRDTGFYRIDFIIRSGACSINVFGSGIRRPVQTIKGHIGREDVLSAFDALGMEVLYEQSVSVNGGFLAVYPLSESVNIMRLPAVVGHYNLPVPGDTVFTDARVHASQRLFHSERPVNGYPFIATGGHIPDGNNIIYTLDSVPGDFGALNLDILVPGKCPSCGGEGCSSCRELGYLFESMQGVYSSEELKNNMREGMTWQR